MYPIKNGEALNTKKMEGLDKLGVKAKRAFSETSLSKLEESNTDTPVLNDEA